MTRNRLLTFLLVVCLGLSTVGFGIARGQTPAVGQMVICSGFGMTVVSVDADGNPTVVQGLCPDAATLFHSVTAPEQPTISPVPLDVAEVIWPEAAFEVLSHPPIPGSARGPPA